MTVTLPAIELAAGRRLVPTEALTTLLECAPLAIANRRIICIDGHAGAGKTNSLEVLRAAAPAGANWRVVTVKLDEADSRKGVIEKLLDAISDAGMPRAVYNTKDLMAHLTVLLAMGELIIMVDEAQNASIQALQLVRSLHEHPTSRFGLVLSGVGMRKHLIKESMLWSRVGMTITHRRLSGKELVAFLHQMHPAFESFDADTLVDVDDVLCHGDLRKWVILVEWLNGMTRNGAAAPTEDQLRRVVGLMDRKDVL